MAFSRDAIVTLNYVSLYFERFAEAVDFYTKVFGAPDQPEEDHGFGSWKMGSTWLTLFPSRMGVNPEGDPVNAEFGIQVQEPAQVDELSEILLENGAKLVMAPEDTWMYESMRFVALDDPFGVRIDVYCPIPGQNPK